MSDNYYRAQKGEYGGKLLTTAATHTPDTGVAWCCLEFLTTTSVTAITLKGNTGSTAFTGTAGTRLEGLVTSITLASGHVWAKNDRRV